MYLTSPHLSIPFFFFNDTATTEIYTLSLHDALPILRQRCVRATERVRRGDEPERFGGALHGRVRARRLLHRPSRAARLSIPQSPDRGQRDRHRSGERSEEHTSELQSLAYLVCRLLLE